MKLINEKNKLTIITNKQYNKENIKDYLKETLLKIKKKYNKKISGFYDVIIYKNNKVGMIIELEKDENINIYSDIIDINIKYSKTKIYLEFDNPCIIDNKLKQNIKIYKNKYYIDTEKISNSDYIKLLEFTNLIYGKKLNNIEQKMIKLKV